MSGEIRKHRYEVAAVLGFLGAAMAGGFVWAGAFLLAASAWLLVLNWRTRAKR